MMRGQRARRTLCLAHQSLSLTLPLAPAQWTDRPTNQGNPQCQPRHYADLEASGLSSEQAGHDFWLTRNGHGAGFWDRGLGALGERLSKESKPYGSCDLYVGDDGQIYGF